MDTDARWQQDLVAALHLDELFISSGLAFPKSARADSINPTHAESIRAVAKIPELPHLSPLSLRKVPD